MLPGGTADETPQAMENICLTLERCGLSLDHVIKATVTLADMSQWTQMNEVYVIYFDKHPCPRGVLWALRDSP
jgi:2-iminobutanoate/2-iminopropanoate deaminase